jgi:hypothetical protein
LRDVAIDDVRRKALLLLHAGREPSTICVELSITADQLAAWERSVGPAELRPEGAASYGATLQSPRPGAPRGGLGTWIGAPDHPANGDKTVHIVDGSPDGACSRCGFRAEPPHRVAPVVPRGNWAYLLVEKMPGGVASFRVVTEEESRGLPACRPLD